MITHENAPRLRKVISLSMSEPGTRLPLQSARIDYAGQVVALVIADTLQAARDGVASVGLEIDAGSAPVVILADAEARLKSVKRAGIGPGRSRKGDADAALAGLPSQPTTRSTTRRIIKIRSSPAPSLRVGTRMAA